MIENTFIQSPEYQDYLDNKEQISEESIIFVEEEGKEKLIEHGKEFNFVPSGGESGQVLQHTENGIEWKDNTIITQDGEIITELRIVDSDDEIGTLLTKEVADTLYQEQLPEGEEGQVLTKTENGVEWKSNGSGCECPKIWNVLGTVEFDFGYTTTDNQQLNLLPSSAVISHTWDSEANKGKIQFNSTGVPKQYFYLQDTLKTIDVVAPCPKIGEAAFRGCINMEEINLGDSVTKFGAEAFQNNQLLSEITIPEGTKEIPNKMFIGCHHLKEEKVDQTTGEIEKIYDDGLSMINLPESLEKIGDEAFEDCTYLGYSNQKNVPIKIPTNLKHIGKRAFQQCEHLTFENWDFWNNIETFGEKAFQSCHALNYPDIFKMPDTMTEIPNEAFSYCYKLNTIDLNKVEKVGSKAFMSCCKNNVTSAGRAIDCIKIPSSVKFIGKQAFFSDKKYDSDNSSNPTTYHIYIAKVDVEDINDYVQIEFEDSNSHPNCYFRNTCELYQNGEPLNEVNITAPIKVLDQNMFVGFKNITKITLPETIEEIKTRAFGKNNSNMNYDFSNLPNLKSVAGKAFLNIDIYSTISFANCTNLTYIGDSLVSGTGAYYTSPSIDLSNCPLTEITEDSKFLDNIYLRNINLSGSGLSSIFRKMFYGYTSLESLNISNCKNMTAIGQQALYGCNYITNFDASNSSIQTIDEQAFSDCSRLNNPNFENCENLRVIGRKAFEKCSGLTEINLNGCTNLQEIGEQAFYTSGGKNLTSIDLTQFSKLTTIGSKALYHLTELRVPDTATYLGSMDTWTTGSTSNSTLKDIYIIGTNKVAQGLVLTKPTYHVDSTMIEQYRSTYPSLTFVTE